MTTEQSTATEQSATSEQPAEDTSRDSAEIAVLETHIQAEAAVKELQRSGFDMKKLSIIGKGYHSEEHPVGFYTTGDRIKSWGGMGAFWGGIWGLLLGAAFLWVPGIGPLAFAGPIVHMLVGGVEGAVLVGGLSAVGAALAGLGMSRDAIVRYESELTADRFLLIVHGSGEEVARAREILARHHAAMRRPEAA